MNNTRYHQYIGATTACTKRMMEATTGLGQRKYKGATKDFVFLAVGFPWRGHLKLWWMLVLTLLVWWKPNTKGFWYDTINNMTKDCPVGSYLVFNSKSMVSRYRLMLAIGYNYNSQKVISSIATEGAGSTKYDILCLSNYSDQFTHVAVWPIFCPHIMSKFSRSAN